MSTSEYNLTSQIVTSRFSDKWGGNRRPPYAFTEIGVAMLSSVLKSEVAIQANRKIIVELGTGTWVELGTGTCSTNEVERYY
jgi:hypothetical protein